MLSSMDNLIDLRRMSFDNIIPIASSRASFGELFVNVVQNTSQLAGKLERSARDFNFLQSLAPRRRVRLAPG